MYVVVFVDVVVKVEVVVVVLPQISIWRRTPDVELSVVSRASSQPAPYGLPSVWRFVSEREERGVHLHHHRAAPKLELWL